MNDALVDPEMLAAYARKSLEAMRTATDRVDDDQLDTRPFGAGTNSISAIIVHSVAVCEFWLGHVGLGRPSDRDREGEFTATADRGELGRILEGAIEQVTTDLRRLAADGGQPSELRAFLSGDQGDLSLAVHVLEELFQHLGHIEVTADALAAGEG